MLGLEFVPLGRSAGRGRVGCSKEDAMSHFKVIARLVFVRTAGFSGQLRDRA